MMQSLQCRGDPKCLLKSRGTNLFNIFFFFIIDIFFLKFQCFYYLIEARRV